MPHLASGLHRRTRRLLTALLSVLALGGVAATTAHAGQWSPYFTLKTGAWGDCRIKSGVVKDVYSPWRAIGGGAIHCSTRHDIGMYVQVVLNDYDVAHSSWGQAYSLGTGYTASGDDRKVETPRAPFCGYGHWKVVTTVSLSPYGGTRSVTQDLGWTTVPC
jgi:hypothetical protein